MRLWRPLLLVAATTASAVADPTAVLGRVLLKIRASLKVMPNYTCVETLTRDYYAPLAPVDRRCDVLLEMKKNPTLDMRLHHTFTDRVRLEVGFTKRGEIVSWAGENRFDDRRIDEVVPEGPVGTGAFGAMLSLIFAQDVQTFQFKQELDVDGQLRLEYSYDVPPERSHYQIKLVNGWLHTGYHGGFEIDPVREEVTRLWLETAILPPAATTCQTRTDAEFSPVTIGAGVFPMATAARQHFVSGEGREVVNTLAFSNCREYRGESSIRFGEEALASGGPSSRGAESAEGIPGRLDFTMALTEAIDASVAAAGDRFFARLAEPLRDRGRLIAPAGSRIEGRIVRVHLRHRPDEEAIVVLRPDLVETRGMRLPLSASRDLRRLLNAVGQTRTRIVLPYPNEGFAGAFLIRGNHAVLPEGFLSDWRTVAR